MRPAESEVMRLVCDSGALHAATGWAPRHSLEDGLATTAQWFSDAANLARYRWGAYNV
jgi:nucleoside-diphosphate-sugar epimerase